MIRVPFQRTSDCFVGKQIAIYIFFCTKKEIKLYGMEMEFIFSQGAGLQGKTDCEARVRLSPLILGYSRQVRVYTRWFNHLLR